MLEFESIFSNIELDLDLERCLAALPRMLDLSRGNALALTRAYLLAARCASVAKQASIYEEMLQDAKTCAVDGPLEAKARVALLEASLFTAKGRYIESYQKLQFALQNKDDLSSEVRGLTLSILGRNQISQGAYVEAIDNSHEAIALSPPLSSAAAFANCTIALVFEAMGRYVESEHYALEQLRIMSERGATQWLPGIYSMLSRNAAESKDFTKAQQYAQLGNEVAVQSGVASNSYTLQLLWQTSAHLDSRRLSEALVSASEAVVSANAEANRPMLMNAFSALGETYFQLGSYGDALEAFEKSLENPELLGDAQKLHAYRRLAETYKALDRKAEAFDICYKLWELQADFDNRTREALLRYHKALEEKVYAQKSAMLNMRAAQMERELAMSATQLVAQVDLLGRFRNDLREIVRQSRSDDPALKQVKDKLKELPCEQIDWVNFDAQFSSVHPEFKSKLHEKHPDLTRSETKICALSRMKLTSEEIGRLLCLSERTVQTHRLNIRKKLGLRTEQNLGTYLASL